MCTTTELVHILQYGCPLLEAASDGGEESPAYVPELKEEHGRQVD